MKSTILGIMLSLWALPLLAQSENYQVKGVIQDTLGNPLIYSTVLLLEKGDSTMVDFTQSEIDGSFKFKDIPAGQHLVKSTYLGYIPVTIDASSLDGENVDLGILPMTELAAELMEVVIKAARAPIKMRGDTVEYDASTFKVPEGSTVEDLLRRLPGLEVEQDGSILADGKNVSTVTVDGKSFFGSDPKAATKNLPAEGISKVQVFDTKTEEEEITGATSQSQDKTMNLELKDEFKSGGFGKVVAGVGTADRRELKGNFNRFNDKIQFSLVGVANNTGRNGLSWDDYQDFLGANAFTFGDDSDYGFGGGGRNFYFTFGGGNDIESSIQSIFLSGGNNAGLPNNYNGGINFNYDDKKTKVSSVYYYNQAELVNNTLASSERFYSDFTQTENSVRDDDDNSSGHRMELEYEKKIDSLHTIKIHFNGAYINKDEISLENAELTGDGISSVSEFQNETQTNGYLANGLVLFRKKFQKKGRSMGLNTSYLTTQLNTDWTQNSVINFFDSNATPPNSQVINQINESVADKTKLKANALFVEPLSKKFFFQTFYNYSNRKETGDREVLDVEGNINTLNDDLSRTYENTIQLNRVGSLVRYSHNGVNVSTGLAYQSFDLEGVFSAKGASDIMGTVDKTFQNWIPNLSVNFTPVRNAYINLGYSRNAQEPAIQNLQPIVNNINPLFIRVGNSELTPQISNDISSYISRSYPASGVRFNLNVRMSFFENQFSTEQSVDENLITTSKSINIDGGNSANIYAGFNFPIIKNKLTTRLGFNSRFSDTPTIVNGVMNNTDTKNYQPSIRINITPSDNFALYLNGRLNNTNTQYDINTSQNQKVKNRSLGVEMNAKLAFGLFLNANFEYDKYENERFNVDEEIPILNASLSRQFLKGNKAELRLSIYDAFNNNIGFSQSTNINGVFRSQSTTTVARYVMLSLTYNIRGLQSKVKKDSWW